MPFLTLKVVASLLQLHGAGASIQSDHQGIDALLGDIRRQGLEEGAASATPVYFRRAAGFRRGGGGYGGAFRRGGFVRGY
jgi:hypothetical protein